MYSAVWIDYRLSYKINTRIVLQSYNRSIFVTVYMNLLPEPAASRVRCIRRYIMTEYAITKLYCNTYRGGARTLPTDG